MTRPNSAAAVIATLLTLHVAACRNEPAAPAPGAPAAAQPAAPASQPAQPAAPASQPTQPPATAPQPTAPLPTQPAQAAAQPTASLASADSEQPGLRVEIQELKRTEGGTVTLKLAFINTGGRNIFNLGGFDEINLIDAVGKKKYFVAEDSAGTCLCSGSLVNFETDARANVWAKFPAPPEDVQKIAVVVPKFPPIEGIPISR